MKEKIIVLQSNPTSWVLKGCGIVDEIRDYSKVEEVDWHLLTDAKTIILTTNDAEKFLVELRRKFSKFRPLVVCIGEKPIEEAYLVFGISKQIEIQNLKHYLSNNPEMNISGHTSFPAIVNLKKLLKFLNRPRPNNFGITAMLSTLGYKFFTSDILHKMRNIGENSKVIDIIEESFKKSNTLFTFLEDINRKSKELNENNESSIAQEIRAFAWRLENRLLSRLGKQPSEEYRQSILREALKEIEEANSAIKRKYLE